MNKASLSQKMNKEEITTVDEIMPIEKMKNDMKEIIETSEALNSVKNQEIGLKSEIETLVSQSSPIFELRKECEQKLLNIQKYTNLAEIVAEKNKILQKQKDDLSLHLQQTSKSFTLAQEMLIEKQKVLQKLGTTEATRREIILLTQQKNFRNRQIVEQMRDKIFIVKAIPSIQPPSGPSNGQSSGDVKQSTMSVTYNYSVNGQGVSRDGMYLFDEEAAAALSSVAQCLKLLEKLYQIPLRFQVFPFGSRSFICGVENFELFQHQMKSFQKSIENSTFAAPEFENSNEKSEKNKQEDGNQANFGSGGENSSSNPQNLSSSPGFSNLNQENSGISGSTLSANSSTASSFTVDQDVLQKSLVPLFFIKGGDKSKYLSAVKYLNKNIFHMCKMKNLPRIGLSSNSKCIVENTRFLLDAFLASENV